MLNGKTTQINPYGPIFSPIELLVLEIMINLLLICGRVWWLLPWKPGFYFKSVMLSGKTTQRNPYGPIFSPIGFSDNEKYYL